MESPEAKLTKLRNAAIDAVAAESRVLGAGRQMAEGLLVTGTNVLAGLHPLAVQLREKLLRQVVTETDVDVILRRLALLAKTLGEASAASEKLIAAQRLLLGAPSSIIEHRGGQTPSPTETPAEAAARIRAVMDELAAADRRLDAQGRPRLLDSERTDEGQA